MEHHTADENLRKSTEESKEAKESKNKAQHQQKKMAIPLDQAPWLINAPEPTMIDGKDVYARTGQT